MTKDWTGNKNSIYTCLGASNHVAEDRQAEDYYATDPIAAEWLLKLEPELNDIWECACGEGHLAKVFNKADKLGYASDLIDRNYGEPNVDFLKEIEPWEGDIVTNPPYKYAKEFTEKAMELVDDGHKVCMFLKITFLESQDRKSFFEKYPPKTIYVSSSRIPCAKNGEFAIWDEKKGKEVPVSSAVAYAWYVWEKGYTGETVIKWFN